MRLVKVVVLGLVASLALLAVGAAGAAASEPSIWQCGSAAKNAEKKYTGGYEKGCTTANGKKEGQYEFEEFFVGSKESKTGKKGKVKEIKAKGAKGTYANLDIVGLGGLLCTKMSLESKDGAAFTGPKTGGKFVAEFSSCVLIHSPCTSIQPGSKPGEIKTYPLKAEIGYINKAEHRVGVIFSPETGTYLAHFTCTNENEYRVKGSVIGEVLNTPKGPYNKWSKELTLSFRQANGGQLCGPEGAPYSCTTLEGVPGEHVLLTEGSKLGTENFAESFVSGEAATVEGKGEELYLKA